MSETAAARCGLRYDLRHPAFGQPAEVLYREALAQLAWCDQRGFSEVQISEHHGAEDGYCPSPLTFAAAASASTTWMAIVVAALLLPLHDPVRIAEEIAMVDLISGGRLTVVFGAGYRRAESDLFGADFDRRAQDLEEKLPVVRAALSGHPIVRNGRSILVTPRPVQVPHPPLVLAGATTGAAKRAARVADGFYPVDLGLYDVYLDACAEVGCEPGPPPPVVGPLFVHVAEDPEAAWVRIRDHVHHDAASYAGWAGVEEASFEEVRTSGDYVVVTPEECVALGERLGPGALLLFHPLLAGLDPDVGWESLELVASRVLPKL